MTRAFEQLRAIPGVHATTLVYHHSETLDDESPANKESKP
jgi:nitrate reductase NapAB chaperone NapD